MPRGCSAALALVVAIAGAGCALQPTLDPNAPPGTPAHPLRAPTFMGFLEYMGRLRCPDGSQPHARGFESRVRGPDGVYLHRFRLRCIYMNRESVALVDLQPGDYVEPEPLPGYTMSRGPDRRRLFWLP